MKTLLTLVLSLSILSSCSRAVSSTQQSLADLAQTGTPGSITPSNGLVAQDPSLPLWIDELPPEDALWGIGFAKQSTVSLSRTTARNRAVMAIIRQIDKRVKNMFTDYNRDAGAGDTQASLSLQEDVIRTLTNVDMSGTETNANWAASDGTYWIRVAYPKADLLETMEQIFDGEAARYAEFRADQALAMLENELSRSERPQGVRN